MSIKSLGKNSLIYGLGHILARLVTFFLLPLYTHVFTPKEYGVISLAYAFMCFAMIFYSVDVVESINLPWIFGTFGVKSPGVSKLVRILGCTVDFW